MWKNVICYLLCITTPFDTYAKNIRQIESNEQNVIGIRTAIGYSTIIEFPSKPISAVLGDQDAFKLEYVGNSITVKPLIPHARSNLFVFTEYDRFNCTLSSGSPSEVDYIVKVVALHKSYPIESGVIKNGDEVPTVSHVTKVNKSATFGGYSLKVTSMTQSGDKSNPRATAIIDIELSSQVKNYAYSVGAVGVKQAKRFVSIESIYLDRLELTPGNSPIRGKIVLLSQDFKRGLPLTVVFAVPGKRAKKVQRLEVTIGKQGSLKEKRM